MTLDELKNMIREILKSEMDETSTTGGVPGYQTPKAFSKNTDSKSNAGTEEAERLGFSKAKETHVNFKEIWESKLVDIINEVSYNEYKKYPGMTSKQKLNMAIKECNRALWEIERYLKQNKKLKEEEQLGLTEYWKSTSHNIVKMNERVKRIQKEIKKFGLKEIQTSLQENEAKNVAIEKQVAKVFKALGLNAVKVDSNAFGLSAPNVEVTFKNLSYGGGDEYDIMNDYNDEYPHEPGSVIFSDVTTHPNDPNKLTFYIDKKESKLQ